MLIIIRYFAEAHPKDRILSVAAVPKECAHTGISRILNTPCINLKEIGLQNHPISYAHCYMEWIYCNTLYVHDNNMFSAGTLF